MVRIMYALQAQDKRRTSTKATCHHHRNVYNVYHSHALFNNLINNSRCSQWLNELFQTLNTNVNNTECEIKNQNTKWQNVDSTLQAQSNRMPNNEEQLSEMGGIKSKITHMKNTVTGMSHEITNNMN